MADLNMAESQLGRPQQGRSIGAHLVWADLDGADLRKCRLGFTILGDVDLSTAKGLETVVPYSPSIIDIDTIYKSKGNIPEVFLRGAGVPEDMIAYIRSVRGKAIEFYSCFISHSAKDKRFWRTPLC